MHGRAVDAIDGPLAFAVVGCNVGHRLRDPTAACTKTCNVGLAHEHGARGLVADPADCDATVEDDVRGLRVRQDVDAGLRPQVAHPGAAAHDGDLSDPLREPGFETQRDRNIGVRADDRDNQLPAMAARGVDDELCCVHIDRCRVWLGQLDAIKAARSMGVRCEWRFADKRAIEPARHGNHQSGERQHTQRIARGELDCLVAKDRCDTHQVEMPRRIKNRDSVVVSGIAVDQEFLFHARGRALQAQELAKWCRCRIGLPNGQNDDPKHAACPGGNSIDPRRKSPKNIKAQPRRPDRSHLTTEKDVA